MRQVFFVRAGHMVKVEHFEKLESIHMTDKCVSKYVCRNTKPVEV